jgi:hypothetical protein
MISVDCSARVGAGSERRRVTMASRALCVGINNYPGTANDLSGCVNDAHAWAKVLVDHYDYPKRDVTTLVDSRATKKTILRELDSLLAGAKSGDRLVFTMSSHGTYLKSEDDDESYDEAVCPYDCATNVIVDDELRARFQNLAKGVSLSVVLDTCYSGTGTRAPERLPTTDQRKRRFMPPNLLGLPTIRGVVGRASTSSEKFPQRSMHEVLLAAARDDQESWDAQFGNTFHGALTFYALQELERARYHITWNTLLKHVTVALEDGRFDQDPQVEGKARTRRKLAFV